MAYLFHDCDSEGRAAAPGRTGYRAASDARRQPPLAPGAAGQMKAEAAVAAIGAQHDSGRLRRGDGVCLAGKALFLAADGEAGTHGVELAACGEGGKAPDLPTLER